MNYLKPQYYERTLNMIMEKIHTRKTLLLEKEYRTEVLGRDYSFADDLELKYLYIRADQLATAIASQKYAKKNDIKTITVNENHSEPSSPEPQRVDTSTDLRKIWEGYIQRKRLSTHREDS